MGQKRLRKVAKLCEAYGLRVQNSVFECQVTSVEKKQLVNELEQIIDTQKDSLRFYNLGTKYTTKILHIGSKSAPDITDVMIL